MDHDLRLLLNQIRRRLQQSVFSDYHARACVFAMGLCLFLTISGLLFARQAVVAVFAIWVLGRGWSLWSSRQSYQKDTQVADAIEREYPELKQGLLTAAHQLQDNPDASEDGQHRYSYLQQMVFRDALGHYQKTGWELDSVGRAIRRNTFQSILALAAIAVLFWFLPTPLPAPLASRITSSDETAVTPEPTSMQVDPGDAEVERGRSLIVAARFSGAVPVRPTLIRLLEDGSEEKLPLTQRLEDPLFAVQLNDVQQPFQYRIEHESGQSEAYQVTVFEYPRLLQADADLAYPEYTKLARKQLLNTRRVSVVEGTQITWQLHLNKSIAKAWLEDEEGNRIELTLHPEASHRVSGVVSPSKDGRWKVRLSDERGRENPDLIDLTAQVLPNRLPEITPQGSRDLSASPLEELSLQAKYWDDFGLVRYGLSFALGVQPAKDMVLGQDSPAAESKVASHALDFESLQAKPDELVAYHFWAEDLGPNGKPRRAASDLYFIEVRRFEDIFRQGVQPNGDQQSQQNQEQSGPQGGQSEQVLEMQKQILAGTWNIVRRELTDQLTPTFSDDVKLLAESQQSAREMLQSMANEVSDPELVLVGQEVGRSMQKALDQLESAYKTPSREGLPEAVAAEQAAYQGLLRLRAREFQVVQSSRSGSPGASQSQQGQRQQQLQELQLQQDVNRYESERQASANDTREDRERRQIQSRLQDLARRQQDLNRELAPLQNELSTEASNQQQREREQQLRRLRDQQQELLEEADELAERINRAPDQRNWQETRQQMEQSRERMRQSQEAVSQGEPAQALASGTRAEQQLRQMTDQLRQQSASQYRERVESLSQQARQLEQNQQQLSERMTDSSANSPGLRASATNQKLRDSLQQQKKMLEDLLVETQQTVKDAETSEPLLARQLYEVYQQAQKDEIARKLDTSSQLLDQADRETATQVANSTQDGISRLREGMQRAERDVLGSDLESWRRAADELSHLTEALKNSDPPSRGNPDAQVARNENEGNRSRPDAPEESEMMDRPSNTRKEDADADRGAPNTGDPQGTTGDQESKEDSPSGASNSGQSSQSAEDPAGGQQAGGQQAGGQQAGGQQAGGDRGGNGSRDRSAWNAIGGTDVVTGPGAEEWSDRLRDVEELLDEPSLRNRASQIRERVRELRREQRRHSEPPKWSLIEELIATPLYELQRDVEEELRRRNGRRDELVPVDRDPVPGPFVERVRKYYERLGQGE